VMNRILSSRLGTFIVDEEWSWFADECAELQLSKHPPNLHQLLNIGVHSHVLEFHARGSHGVHWSLDTQAIGPPHMKIT
jgi:hypothetical protein